MARLLTPARLVGAVVGLVVVAGIVLYLVPSNDYLLLPDRAHPVAPLVVVQGGHSTLIDEGTVYELADKAAARMRERAGL